MKLIDCRTGECIRTLTGHRRTPWVVRFHPKNANILASGSLDHEVRLWNAATAECILCFDFGKPIASLAFHSEGDVLAVASGHKLYTWNYTKAMNPQPQRGDGQQDEGAEAGAGAGGEARAGVSRGWMGFGSGVLGSFPRGSERRRGSRPSSAGTAGGGAAAAAAGGNNSNNSDGGTGAERSSSSEATDAIPCISLRTRRSLRAVHFHPHGAPLLLSAEVNETSEQDIPPLRAMTAPHPAGEWETAYAAASAEEEQEREDRGA